MKNITKDEQQTILLDALEHLAQAEDAVRSLDDTYLNAYVADHIDAQGRMLGKGLAGLLQKKLDELSQGEEN